MSLFVLYCLVVRRCLWFVMIGLYVVFAVCVVCCFAYWVFRSLRSCRFFAVFVVVCHYLLLRCVCCMRVVCLLVSACLFICVLR